MTHAPMVCSSWRTRQHGGHDAVAVRAAFELGMQPSAVEALMRGPNRVNLRAAVIIHAFKKTGQEQRLCRWMSPIEAALKGILAPTDSPALAVQARTADADEDCANVAYMVNRTRDTAQALVRAIDVERTLMLEYRQALAGKWGLV